MINEIILSDKNQDNVNRYCGVLLYEITLPPEYSNFATTNKPLTG